MLRLIESEAMIEYKKVEIKDKNNVIIKPLFHKNEKWIGIYFDYDLAIVSLIKTIKDRKYSKSNNCWYIPYTKEAFRDFKNLNISYQTSTSSGTTDSTISQSVHTGIAQPTKLADTVTPINSTNKAADIQQVNNSNVLADPTDITWNNQKFFVKIRMNKSDIDFLKTLKGTWWNANHKVWVVRSSIENLCSLQKHFCYWSKGEYEKLMELIKTLSEPQHLTLYISPQHPDKLIIKLFGYKADFSFLKNLPERSYDQANKRWILPFDVAFGQKDKRTL